MEKPIEQGMTDPPADGVALEVGLRNIGGMGVIMNQHMIPGLIAVGLGLIILIPLFIGLTTGIAIVDHTAVGVTLVTHNLADSKSVVLNLIVIAHRAPGFESWA